jgi:hypothetical protein
MGQAALGLDGQVLELQFENSEIQPIPLALGWRWRSVVSNPNTLIARLRTIVGWHDADDHGNDNDDRPQFSTRRVLHLPSGVDAWPCLWFVCFRAS